MSRANRLAVVALTDAASAAAVISFYIPKLSTRRFPLLSYTYVCAQFAPSLADVNRSAPS